MICRASVVLVTLVSLVALLFSAGAQAQTAPGSGYAISSPQFQNYFDHRGGARVLGQPISREFEFLGSRVQFFQRVVLQQRSDGSVGPLNLLDEGLMNFTRIGGLTLPARDPSLGAAAPPANDPDYGSKSLLFVQENTPDRWDALQPNFYTTYSNSVGYQDAFPQGEADRALVPLVNLEIWGFPTSQPMRDPRNGNFVYQRFERGILHFDNSSGDTRWLPVGEYLKALLTGRDLPPDLEQEAQGSRLLRQYDNSRLGGVVNPATLPSTNMFAAFEEAGVVVPTPAPTATPAPSPTPQPVPTEAVPETPAKPDWIAVTGSPWFIDQSENALALLPDTTREYIYSIVEVSDYSRFDIRNRTLYIIEKDAFVPSLRDVPDCQIQWYAGWIAHQTVHAEQFWTGRPTTGLEAEKEAWLRQREFLLYNDSCDGALPRKMLSVINDGQLSFSDWSAP